MTDSYPLTITITWESRQVRLSYHPRRFTAIDHVEVQSLDGQPLPISETGYRSHFFGPVEPALPIEDVTAMMMGWLNSEAAKAEWQSYLKDSQQLSLF
jgi:hypothetical protein